MRRYETVVILMPEVGDDERASMEKRWTDIIAQFKGELIKMDDWGQKKLAYDIKKESRGHYLFLDYCTTGADLIKELERVFRLEDNVLKYMTVKVSEKVDIEAIREQEKSEEEAIREQEKSEEEAILEQEKSEEEAIRKQEKSDKEAMEKEAPTVKTEDEPATEQESSQEKGEIE